MGYRIEYAASSRAGCKGPKPCSGTKIEKGTLRFGTVVTIKEHQSLVWRHFGCLTPKIFANIKQDFPEPSDVEGFEDLNAEDQKKFEVAIAEGHVRDEDIPDSARKVVEVDEDGNPVGKKKAAPKAKKTAQENLDEELGQGSSEVKKKVPVKKVAAKKAAKKIESDDEDEESAVSTEESDAPTPKKKKASKKSPAKKSKKQYTDSEDESDFRPKKKSKKSKKDESDSDSDY